MARVNRGDTLPHFETRTIAGARFDYATVWQRRHLVLIRLPATASADDYAGALYERTADFDAHQSVCVVTHDEGPGLPSPAALVADRWGEVVYLITPARIEDMPTPQDLIEWTEHLEHRCPECEGEAR